MTPRKELFTKIKEALTMIPELELIDLQRKQFKKPAANYPQYFTCALIEIGVIKWESMVEQKQEGLCDIEIMLYCKDGWMEQHQKTSDPEGGLIEIDLIDIIVEQLQGLQGDYFKPLRQTADEPGDDLEEIMSYKIKFSTTLYRRLEYKYTKKKLIN
ncbi:hypothetical protein [Flavobacterium sp. N1994]|uniref:hypothetical protein n=1 Tax=Flavobacterium sp. N1994 TaxID=2986827 RepID=UPI002221C8FF|nr:hypothetical protein [Flavobacterium sp. N1994]